MKFIYSCLRLVRLHTVSVVASHLVPHIPVNTSNHYYTCVDRMWSDWAHRLSFSPMTPEIDTHRIMRNYQRLYMFDARGWNLASQLQIEQKKSEKKTQVCKQFWSIFARIFFFSSTLFLSTPCKSPKSV